MIGKVKKPRKPTVCCPKSIIDSKYTGKLYGYYIKNTNYYNIVSTAVAEGYEDAHEIGEIIADNVTPTMQEGTICGFYVDGKLQFKDSKGEDCKIEIYSTKLDIFSRNTGILESDMMANKGVIFIGCGSVGSLAALELAKAGVGRFMLVDNDILAYHNLCRHQCGVKDIGKFKTDAVKERILQVNPTAKVITQNMQIQDVPLAVLNDFCDTNTIVIGGADNRDGDLYANGFAKEVGMPFISLGMWERAFAGEIFYCLPTGMPDYSDFIKAIGYTSGRVNQNRVFYTAEEDIAKTVFEPGISVDIDFVTIIATKLAIDLLNRDEPNYTCRLLGHLSQYTLICNTNNPKIGGDMAEIFSYPLQVTTSIEVPYANK
jgi:molybdopterin/thiamine biosynthesis adenylyltransferase